MTSFDGYNLTSIDLSFLKNDDIYSSDAFAHSLRFDPLDDHTSDLSDPDLFNKDAHLLDVDDSADYLRLNDVQTCVKALSLDEVPFDRDIRYNVTLYLSCE